MGVAEDVGVGSNPGIPPEHPVKRIKKTKSNVKRKNLVCRSKIILQKKVEWVFGNLRDREDIPLIPAIPREPVEYPQFPIYQVQRTLGAILQILGLWESPW